MVYNRVNSDGKETLCAARTRRTAANLPDWRRLFLKKRLLCILLIAAMLVAVIAISASAATDTSANEKEIYAFLTGSLGLNTAAASGIMANIYYETGFRADLAVGTYYGLFMYYGPLAAELRAWCSSNGYDYSTVAGQMAFFKVLLEGGISGYNYDSLLASLRSVSNTADGAYSAGDMFCRQFERPANLSYEANKRGSYASSTIFPKYQGVSGGSDTAGGAIAEVPASYTAYVTASELNVRSGPGTGYGRISGLSRGSCISVTAESSDGGWCKLASGGWVSKSYVSTTPPSSETGSGGSTYYVNASALNVRSGVGTSYGVTDCLYNGESVSITAEATCAEGNPWGKLASGGWVCKTYLTSSGSGSGYQVTASALNVRSGAGMSYEVINALTKGSSVTIVKTETDASGTQWGQLVSGGWISMEYVA